MPYKASSALGWCKTAPAGTPLHRWSASQPHARMRPPVQPPTDIFLCADSINKSLTCCPEPNFNKSCLCPECHGCSLSLSLSLSPPFYLYIYIYRAGGGGQLLLFFCCFPGFAILAINVCSLSVNQLKWSVQDLNEFGGNLNQPP